MGKNLQNKEAEPSLKAYQKKLLAFFVIVVLAFIFWSSASLQQNFFASLNMLGEYAAENKILGIGIFLGLAAISAMLSPFSSVPLVPVAIAVFGNFPTVWLLIFGWMLGDTIAYFIGSSAGYAIVRRLASMEKVEYYKKKIPAGAQFWLVLVYRLAVPAEITGYTLGIVRYQFAKYILAVFISEIPFALIAVYASEALVENRPLIFVSLIILGAAIIGITGYALRKYFKKR